MLGRHRKLNLGALWAEEQSEGCVLLGSTAVYRRLMDPSSGCGLSRDPLHPNRRANGGYKQRFEKSESEDSGVELPPPSPFGSESSYNPDEFESIESSTPEEHESLESSSPEESQDLKSHGYVNTDLFQSSSAAASVGLSSLDDAGSFTVHSPQDINRLECCLNQLPERNISGVPQKLEQAIQRSRRQRSSSREAIQNRAARCNRQYVGSLKEQRRGASAAHEAKSPAHQRLENEEHDALNLPGDGLRYLESLCHMLEQIAELQQRNQQLQHQKRTLEKRVQSQVLFLDSCVCGSSRDSRDLEQDMMDNSLPNGTTWQPQHYRKRSSSHAGVLLSLARQPENNLKESNKMDPHYVSVPNLQEDARRRTNQSYKAESTQWFKVKDLLSKISRKNSSPGPSEGSQSNCRTQTMLEEPPQHPRRLFLPGLVIRPRNHGRQFH